MWLLPHKQKDGPGMCENGEWDRPRRRLKPSGGGRQWSERNVGETDYRWAGFRVVLTRKGIDAMCKAYKMGRKKRIDTSEREGRGVERYANGNVYDGEWKA